MGNQSRRDQSPSAQTHSCRKTDAGTSPRRCNPQISPPSSELTRFPTSGMGHSSSLFLPTTDTSLYYYHPGVDCPGLSQSLSAPNRLQTLRPEKVVDARALKTAMMTPLAAKLWNSLETLQRLEDGYGPQTVEESWQEPPAERTGSKK